jgi:selenide,water dikinase
MGPGDLSEVLAPLPASKDPRLLVGRETFDDAGVFLLSDDIALVQTVDFFAPIVDDPYDFGQIAAANALSDVYAMGGQPLTALNIVAFPTGELPLSVLTDILRGGQDKVHEAGAHIVGGHSIIDTELKYGLSVTKPLGNGILATALKRGIVAEDVSTAMIAFMKELNGEASRAALALKVKCATDITGFGLLGHASHIARASGVTLHIHASAIKVLPGTLDALKAGASSDGLKRNRAYLESLVEWKIDSAEMSAVLCDPQTSGGLLVAVPRERASHYLSRVNGAFEIGEVTERENIAIVVD